MFVIPTKQVPAAASILLRAVVPWIVAAMADGGTGERIITHPVKMKISVTRWAFEMYKTNQ